MLQRVWLRLCALQLTQGIEVIILSLPSDTPQERRVLGPFCLNMDVFTTWPTAHGGGDRRPGPGLRKRAASVLASGS